MGKSKLPFVYVDHSGAGTSFEPHSGEAVRTHEVCDTTDEVTVGRFRWLTDFRICISTSEGHQPIVTMFGSHEAGDVFFGTRDPDGKAHYFPPKIHVPTAFDIGDSWSARHDRETGQELRRCDVTPTPWCDNGAAIACTTFGPHRIVWVRNHWCPGSGHTGHEGVVVQSGSVPHWSWSSDAKRGDTVLPDLPIERRPLPDFGLLMGLVDTLTPARLAELSPDDVQLPIEAPGDE